MVLKKIAAFAVGLLLMALLPLSTTTPPAYANTQSIFALVKSSNSAQYWMATVDEATGQKNNFIQLDTTTLAQTASGKFNDLRAAGYSTLTQKFYAFDFETQNLFAITMQTGKIELAGKFLPSPSGGIKITAMAINGDGHGFALTEKNILYQVALETGEIYNPKPLNINEYSKSIRSLAFVGNTLYGYAEVSKEYSYTSPAIGQIFRAPYAADTGRYNVNIAFYSKYGGERTSIPSLGMYVYTGPELKKTNPFNVYLNNASTLLYSKAETLYAVADFSSRGVMADQSTQLVRGLYQPTPLTVEFDSQGGTSTATIYGVAGQTLEEPPAPTKASSDFEGWFTAATGGTKITWPYTLTTSTKQYARWNSTPAQLTFDSHGGSSVAAINGFIGQEIAEPTPDPTKTDTPPVGFDGWYTAATGGTQISWPYTLPGDRTLHAVWSSTPANLTFDSRGGSSLSSISSYVGVEIDKPADPSYTGKTFNGWWTEPTGGTRVTWPYTLSANTTLYARWQTTLTFVSQGGTPLSPLTVEDGSSISRPTDPTYPYKTFKGWFDAPSGGNAITWPVTLNQNTTVYAQWDSIPTTITFDSQGGSSVTAISTQQGDLVDEPTEPTKPNVAFEGWFTETSGGTKITWPHYATELNPTFHAQWNSIPATLTFDTLEGSSVPPITTFVGEEIQKPTAPTKNQRTFIEWYTSPTGGEQIFWPYEISGDTTLYARWAVNATITFDTQGGTAIDPISGSEGDLVAAPSSPTKDGHVFSGWVMRNSPEIPVSWPHSLTRDVVMYAKWQVSNNELANTGMQQNGIFVSSLATLLMLTTGGALMYLRRRMKL